MSTVNALSLIPNAQDFATLKEIASLAFKSNLLPTSIKSTEQAIIIALKGRELGIPPMQAFAHINVINGKPTMSSELMLAQIFKCIPRATINYIETNATGCIIEACRPNCKISRFSFVLDDAQKAGLLTKDTWKKYPDAMYRARAISAMARALFPDALMGVSYTAEEMGCEVDIDEEGNEIIKDVTPLKTEAPKVEKPKVKNVAPVASNQLNFLLTTGAGIGLKSTDFKSVNEQLWALTETKNMQQWQYEILLGLVVKSKSRDEFGQLVADYESKSIEHAKKDV